MYSDCSSGHGGDVCTVIVPQVMVGMRLMLMTAQL